MHYCRYKPVCDVMLQGRSRLFCNIDVVFVARKTLGATMTGQRCCKLGIDIARLVLLMLSHKSRCGVARSTPTLLQAGFGTSRLLPLMLWQKRGAILLGRHCHCCKSSVMLHGGCRVVAKASHHKSGHDVARPTQSSTQLRRVVA